MAYEPKRSRAALGDVSSAVGGVVAALSQIAGIAADPWAGELTCRVRQVVANETGTTIPGCAKTSLATRSPAGLKRPVVGMRGYIWAEQRKPWSYPTAIAVGVGVPFLLGYLFGRK